MGTGTISYDFIYLMKSDYVQTYCLNVSLLVQVVAELGRWIHLLLKWFGLLAEESTCLRTAVVRRPTQIQSDKLGNTFQ